MSDAPESAAGSSAASSASPLLTIPTLAGVTPGTVTAGRAIDELPISGRYVAWTVDDGTDAAAVRAYAEFAEKTGLRLTFFVYSAMASWRTQASLLRPLVQSGQIQLGNHTHLHRDLTTLSTKAIIRELRDCEHFINDEYQVSAMPFFRPPYGAVNKKVREAAASIGFTAPTLWYGNLGDDTLHHHAQVVKNAKKWFKPGRIVIGHANHGVTVGAIPLVAKVMTDRKLTPVTLRDAIRVAS